MEQNKRKVALESLQKVNKYKEWSNYGRAFAHYLVYLELMPEEREEHETKFAEILFCWSVALEYRNQLEDLYKCYLQGLHYFPLSVEILNRFGAHLIRIEQDHQAKKYLQLAYNLDKTNLSVEKNLGTVKTNLIPRWHFRMLNDRKRNEAYFNAVRKVVDEKFNRVLDIGTGCGLLSLYVGKIPHTKRIHAIEESRTLAEIAKEVFRSNSVDKVAIINKYSTEIPPSSLELSNVLITEIFDTALFGEHVLETMIHAHKNLLDTDFKIVPSHANVFITGIECTTIHKKQKFINYNLSTLKFGNLCMRSDLTEPYEAENICDYDHKILTNTHEFIKVDFTDLVQLEQIYSDNKYIPEVELQFLKSGELHAFIIWFDLNLNDQNIITTNPFKENCKCWEQAIVYLDHPLVRKKGDKVHIRVSCVEDKLEIAVLDENINCECIKLSQEAIMFLNDKDLLVTIESLSSNFQGDNLMVLDLMPIPVFGLCLASRKAQIFTTATDMLFYEKFCKLNNIDIANITLIDEDELFKYLECKNMFDIIFCTPILMNGTINENFYQNAHLYMESLKENGIFLPQKISLNLQAIHSDYLYFCNKVDDSNLFDFKISEFINDYATGEQWNLDQSFSPLFISEVSSEYVLHLYSDQKMSNYKLRVLKDGNVNGFLYWYTIDYFNKLTYSTYKSDFYNKACFILNEPLGVKENNLIDVYIKQHVGLLKVSCDE